MEQLKRVRDALLMVTKDVHHFEKTGSEERYIVWQEGSEGDSLHADDKHEIMVISGTIDLFTKQEYDPWVQEITRALEDAEITCRIESIQYEDETGYIHYEWRFEVA